MRRIEQTINLINEKIGILTSFLVLPLVFVVVYEVFMRYVFNAPTTWAFEMTTFIYGMHFALGFAFTHRHDGHVSIDIFEMKLSRKPRAMLRIMTNLIFFVPAIGFLSISSVIYATSSWQTMERAPTSWAPLLAPYKTIMAVGFILLFLQGIARLISDFRDLSDTDK